MTGCSEAESGPILLSSGVRVSSVVVEKHCDRLQCGLYKRLSHTPHRFTNTNASTSTSFPPMLAAMIAVHPQNIRQTPTTWNISPTHGSLMSPGCRLSVCGAVTWLTWTHSVRSWRKASLFPSNFCEGHLAAPSLVNELELHTAHAHSKYQQLEHTVSLPVDCARRT